MERTDFEVNGGGDREGQRRWEKRRFLTMWQSSWWCGTAKQAGMLWAGFRYYHLDPTPKMLLPLCVRALPSLDRQFPNVLQVEMFSFVSCRVQFHCCFFWPIHTHGSSKCQRVHRSNGCRVRQNPCGCSIALSNAGCARLD